MSTINVNTTNLQSLNRVAGKLESLSNKEASNKSVSKNTIQSSNTNRTSSQTGNLGRLPSRINQSSFGVIIQLIEDIIEQLNEEQSSTRKELGADGNASTAEDKKLDTHAEVASNNASTGEAQAQGGVDAIFTEIFQLIQKGLDIITGLKDINRSPEANRDRNGILHAPRGQTLMIPASTLLANDTDDGLHSNLHIVPNSIVSTSGATVMYDPVSEMISYTFNNNPSGGFETDAFTYTVSDGILTDSAVVEVVVEPIVPNSVGMVGVLPLPGNHIPGLSPITNPDNESTLKNTAVLINVLGNDFDLDPDGSFLNIVEPFNNKLLGAGEVSDYVFLEQKARGGVIVEGGQVYQINNQLLYVPSPDFEGEAIFYYGINDDGGVATRALEMVTVDVGLPPIAQPATFSYTNDIMPSGIIDLAPFINDPDDINFQDLLVFTPNGDIINMIGTTIGSASSTPNLFGNSKTEIEFDFIFTPTAALFPAEFSYSVLDEGGHLRNGIITITY